MKSTKEVIKKVDEWKSTSILNILHLIFLENNSHFTFIYSFHEYLIFSPKQDAITALFISNATVSNDNSSHAILSHNPNTYHTITI